MISIKSPHDISLMTEGGKISREILDFALRMCIPGNTPLAIEKAVTQSLDKYGVKGWFKEVNNYQYNTCIAVNEVWLHAIPTNEILKEEDVVSIDLGIIYKGYYLDNCWTVVVNADNSKRADIRDALDSSDHDVTKFLKTGVIALNNAIESAKPGGRIGDISHGMGSTVTKEGYSTIKDYVGHGVGFSSHEDPQIFCNGTRGAGPEIKKGMVLAIEIMYSMGTSDYIKASDGWSVVTKDGKISGMFEHTVAILESGPQILTI